MSIFSMTAVALPLQPVDFVADVSFDESAMQ